MKISTLRDIARCHPFVVPLLLFGLVLIFRVIHPLETLGILPRHWVSLGSGEDGYVNRSAQACYRRGRSYRWGWDNNRLCGRVWIPVHSPQWRRSVAGIGLRALDTKTGLEGEVWFTAFLLLLGNVVNSFIEEGLFRGVMLPHFMSTMSFRWANHLQALLFGLWWQSSVLVALICRRRVKVNPYPRSISRQREESSYDEPKDATRGFN